MSKLWILGALLLLSAVGQNGSRELDPEYQPYRSSGPTSGRLSSVGSDTLNNLMTSWTARFARHHPEIAISIDGKGSNMAPPALLARTALLAPMSRTMTPAEEEAFVSRYGYRPTQIRVAVDALAIYVNKDNPLKSLSLEQVDAIFSRARRRGVRKEIKTWGDLGLGGEWADKPISIYGRNPVSGTFAYFKGNVLLGGDFREEVKEQPGSASVVLGVALDRYAIGYSGIGYRTPHVRAVPLSEKPGRKGIPITPESAYSGDYPLVRYLYIYILRDPSRPCEPLEREFIRFACSRDGQETVIKEGYFPLPVDVAREEVKKVE